MTQATLMGSPRASTAPVGSPSRRSGRWITSCALDAEGRANAGAPLQAAASVASEASGLAQLAARHAANSSAHDSDELARKGNLTNRAKHRACHRVAVAAHAA